MSAAIVSPRTRLPLLVVLAMAVVYVVWGSTYLAIRFALEGFPPLFFPGLRFITAGGILFAVLRLRGYALPTRAQWLNAAIIAFLLLNIGNGAVVYAERSVGSALAATAVATVPLWAALFAGIWGAWPRRVQWLGLVLGFAGIVLLNLGGDFAANPLSAGLLVLSPLAELGQEVQKVTMEIGSRAMKNADEVGAASVPYLNLMGHFVYAYFWARMAKVALEKQDQGDFYKSKLITARFYYTKLLPETTTYLRQIRSGAAPLMEMAEAMF